MTRRHLGWAVAGAIGVLTAGVAVSHAQIWSGGYGGFTPPQFPTRNTFSGGFNFCRVIFTSDHREKRGWDTDYPVADINFSIRLAELTKAHVSFDSKGGEVADPEYVTVRLIDDALFQCPFLVMEDAGSARFSDREIRGL